MKKKIFLSMSAAFALIFFAGCVSKPSEATIFPEIMSGAAVALQKGDTFTVKLSENPTTGYTWKTENAGDGLIKEVKSEYTPESTDKCGAGGVRLIKYETIKAGSAKLKLVLVREWEKGIAPVKTFELNLKISE